MFKIGDRVVVEVVGRNLLSGTIIQTGYLPEHIIDEEKELFMVLYDNKEAYSPPAQWCTKASMKIIDEPNNIMKGLL